MTERELAGMEYDFGDQRSCEVVKKAAFLTEYLNEVPVPRMEVEQLVHDLNEEWQKIGIVGDTVNMTGKCWIVADGEVGEDGSPVLYESSKTQLLDQEVIVDEFEFREQVNVDADGISTEYNVFLAGKTFIADEDDQGGVPTRTALF